MSTAGESASLSAVAPARAAAAVDAPLARRVGGTLVALGCTAVLGLAAWLTPAESGVGTHEQIGMPPCPWVTLGDLPCPTCGMTTAFAHAADGNLLAAFRAQPMGCVLALVTAMALIVGTFVAATGSPIATVLGRMLGPRTGWLCGGAFAAAWLFKVLVYKGVL